MQNYIKTEENFNNQKIPILKIIHEPMPVYRMRYKTDLRNTCLLADQQSCSDKFYKNGLDKHHKLQSSNSYDVDSTMSDNGDSCAKLIYKKTTSKKVFPELEVCNLRFALFFTDFENSRF